MCECARNEMNQRAEADQWAATECAVAGGKTAGSSLGKKAWLVLLQGQKAKEERGFGLARVCEFGCGGQLCMRFGCRVPSQALLRELGQRQGLGCESSNSAGPAGAQRAQGVK